MNSSASDKQEVVIGTIQTLEDKGLCSTAAGLGPKMYLESLPKPHLLAFTQLIIHWGFVKGWLALDQWGSALIDKTRLTE